RDGQMQREDLALVEWRRRVWKQVAAAVIRRDHPGLPGRRSEQSSRGDQVRQAHLRGDPDGTVVVRMEGNAARLVQQQTVPRREARPVVAVEYRHTPGASRPEPSTLVGFEKVQLHAILHGGIDWLQ